MFLRIGSYGSSTFIVNDKNKEKQRGEKRYNLHVRRRGVKKPILEAENSSDGQCQEKKKYNKKEKI